MTIAFSEKTDSWMSRFSYTPDMNGFMDNVFVSFKDIGGIACWIHNDVEASKNTFYGESTNSWFSVVSNLNASMNKAFRALSIESFNNGVEAEVFTHLEKVNTVQYCQILNFDQREEAQYADIGPSVINSVSNYTPIAYVNSTSQLSLNNDIFDELIVTKFSSVSIPDQGVLVTNIGEDEYTYQYSDGNFYVAPDQINQADVLYLKTKPAIDGDQIRGRYALIRVELTDNEGPQEVYAINVEFSNSKLDSE